MTASSRPLPTDMTCTIEGCTNRRSNAGYGRFRTVCEKHHHERYGMNYQKGSTQAKKKTSQFREDLEALIVVAEQDGGEVVKAKIGELLKGKYAV